VDAVAAHDPAAAEEALRAHLVLTANLVAKRMGQGQLF
jgi:DNA-binding GntR family transcriptional regulator